MHSNICHETNGIWAIGGKTRYEIIKHKAEMKASGVNMLATTKLNMKFRNVGIFISGIGQYNIEHRILR